MHLQYTLALCSLGCAAAKQVLPDGIVHFPLTRESKPAGARVRRDAFAPSTIDEDTFLLSTRLGVGSNDTEIQVKIDTASSDLRIWNGSACYPTQIGSSLSPGIDSAECWDNSYIYPEDSSTLKWNSTFWKFSENSDSEGHGQFCQDTITLYNTSAKIENANFVIGEVEQQASVWGLGPIAGQADTTDPASDATHASIPLQMKQQGIIQAHAYSLWLAEDFPDGYDGEGGSLIFGGVDHSMYQETLQTVPMIDDWSDPWHMRRIWVMLNSIGVSQGNSSTDFLSFARPAALDTGVTSIYLPNELYQAFNESIVQNADALNSESGLTFDFSGIQITVPFKCLKNADVYNSDDMEDDIAVVGGSNEIVLGQYFLMWAYTVIDFDNKEVALAPVYHGNNNSDIEAISSEIPQASKAPRYSSTQIQKDVSSSSINAAFFASTRSNSASSTAAAAVSSQGGSSSVQRSGSSRRMASSAASKSTATAASGSTPAGSSESRAQNAAGSTKPSSTAVHSQSGAKAAASSSSAATSEQGAKSSSAKNGVKRLQVFSGSAFSGLLGLLLLL